MKTLVNILIPVFLVFFYNQNILGQEREMEKPNILWLTFEDTSPFEFGCYGNSQISTPVIDDLAKKGVQFTNAWSVAPQCSPARSTLITGCYATTYGMDVHPVPHETPNNILFPQLLRDAGYYCTNNHKTHYNTNLNDKSCWDECNKKASYNSHRRGKNQPFFSVFNTHTSHMGRIRTFHTDGRRDYTKEGIYTQNLKLPYHLPDLPAIRCDFAAHLEAVQDVDDWVNFFIEDLKKNNLYDNTIIFVFSDHGGCLPRGKGYLFETGLKVPLIVYFPDKWKHLASKIGAKDNRLVNFTDLGPTVINLAGIKPPVSMQGKPLFGENKDKNVRDINFAFGTNQLHNYMPTRAASDGRYKLLRSYIPYRQFALRNYYQWGMPSNKAWDKYILKGGDNEIYKQPYLHHTAEMLFDLEKDPFETNNLAYDKQYSDVLQKLTKALNKHIKDTKDLGFFLPSTRFNGCMYDIVGKDKYDLNELYNIADIAGKATKKDIVKLDKALKSKVPDIRFWACVGYAHLAQEKIIDKCPELILKLIDDDDPYVAAEAAYAACYLNRFEKGIKRMMNPKKEEFRHIGYSVLDCLSMDENMRKYIRPFMPELKKIEQTLPHKKNEDPGLMVRGILVNMGELQIKDLHGEESYMVGVKLNRARRPKVPKP